MIPDILDEDDLEHIQNAETMTAEDLRIVMKCLQQLPGGGEFVIRTTFRIRDFVISKRQN